jgi:hypothetical protein
MAIVPGKASELIGATPVPSTLTLKGQLKPKRPLPLASIPSTVVPRGAIALAGNDRHWRRNNQSFPSRGCCSLKSTLSPPPLALINLAGPPSCRRRQPHAGTRVGGYILSKVPLTKKVAGYQLTYQPEEAP